MDLVGIDISQAKFDAALLVGKRVRQLSVPLARLGRGGHGVQLTWPARAARPFRPPPDQPGPLEHVEVEPCGRHMQSDSHRKRGHVHWPIGGEHVKQSPPRCYRQRGMPLSALGASHPASLEDDGASNPLGAPYR